MLTAVLPSGGLVGRGLVVIQPLVWLHVHWHWSSETYCSPYTLDLTHRDKDTVRVKRGKPNKPNQPKLNYTRKKKPKQLWLGGKKEYVGC